MTSAVVGCLVGAALVLLWPGDRLARRRARRRARLGIGHPPDHRRRPGGATGSGQAVWTRAVAMIRAAPGRWALVGGVIGTGWWAGPVAAAMVAAYGGAGLWALGRHRRAVAVAEARRAMLDDLAAAAADLRAGLPVGLPGTDPSPGRAGRPGLAQQPHPAGHPDPLAVRVAAVARLADHTGAPVADLIERIEADARSLERARASAAAQAAGSRATAWLLAGLPIGGVGLGFVIGVDPLAVLLRTPVGALCAAGAVGLQLAGLAWTHRLAGRPEALA